MHHGKEWELQRAPNEAGLGTIRNHLKSIAKSCNVCHDMFSLKVDNVGLCNFQRSRGNRVPANGFNNILETQAWQQVKVLENHWFECHSWDTHNGMSAKSQSPLCRGRHAQKCRMCANQKTINFIVKVWFWTTHGHEIVENVARQSRVKRAAQNQSAKTKKVEVYGGCVILMILKELITALGLYWGQEWVVFSAVQYYPL